MSDPIRDTMIEFDDSLWAMAAEINRQRAEIARLIATLDGDPHHTATPEQRRAWRASAIRYADKLEAEVARLTELQRAVSEFIGYIKAGNNAKAHLQMLFLEVLINEESKNGAKK